MKPFNKPSGRRLMGAVRLAVLALTRRSCLNVTSDVSRSFLSLHCFCGLSRLAVNYSI